MVTTPRLQITSSVGKLSAFLALPAALRHERVFCAVLVATWAMSLGLHAGRSYGTSDSTSNVIAMGHRLQVMRIDAASDTTSVVWLKAFGYRPFEKYESGAMRESFAAEAKDSVTPFLKMPQEYPAAGFSNHFDAPHQSLDCRHATFRSSHGAPEYQGSAECE